MHILFKYPTRQRKDKFFFTLNNLIDNLESPDYSILVTIDEDDKTMNNPTVIQQLMDLSENKDVRIELDISNSKSKIEAVNSGLNEFKWHWDILCLHSDDMKIKVKGFDNTIRGQFGYDLDSFCGLLHFPDGWANEKLCTYPIMHRFYYLLDKFIYHPEFKSVYCDNLQHELAVKRGQYKFVNQQIFEHEHPVWGFGEYDDLMKRNQDKKTYKRDYATYLRLKRKYNLK